MTEVCTKWIKENAPNNIKGDATPVPPFQLVKTNAKWGDRIICVETTVLKILCADKDGLYLKLLSSHGWKTEVSHWGTFFPAKAWLVTSPECYCNLLRNHNNYITNTAKIRIEGMHPLAADKEIALLYLTRGSSFIESIERTKKRNSNHHPGKYPVRKCRRKRIHDRGSTR
eukprot:9662384-Ditylum_brightwellii.AAC.1